MWRLAVQARAPAAVRGERGGSGARRPPAGLALCLAGLPQVWRDITARVGVALLELEAAAPRNPDQVPRQHEEEARRRSEGALPEAV